MLILLYQLELLLSSIIDPFFILLLHFIESGSHQLQLLFVHKKAIFQFKQ